MKKLIYLQAMLCVMFANSLSVLGQNITKQAEANADYFKNEKALY